MEIENLINEKLHKQFLITYTQQEIQDCVEQEAKDMQPDVKINGFRAGKVPVEYIIRIYGEKIRVDTMNKKINQDIKGLISKNNFNLAVNPIYKFREREDIADDKFYLDIDFYLFPDVPEHDFSASQVAKYAPDAASLEEIVDKNLLMLQIITSEFKEKTTDISENDRVSCHIDIKIDGEDAAGLGGDLQILIGHEQIPTEVEAQIVGMKSGEDKIFEHSYAADAKNLFFDGIAGKTVTFHVSVKSVSEPIITELNDEKLKNMGFDSADVLIETLRKNTVSMLDQMSAQKLHGDVIEFIRGHFDFDIPEVVLRQEANEIAFNEASRLTNSDAMAEVLAGMRQVTPSEEHLKRAKNNLIVSFVLTDYARKNDITVEDWEVKREMENHLEELKRMNSVRPDQKDKNYNEFMVRVRTLVFERKVVKAISEKINQKETFLPKDEFFEIVKAK